MIHIKRTPVPPCLEKDGKSKGDLETQRAIYHFTSGKQETFDFSAYKDVKNELEIMFHGKCAYCESTIDYLQYPHIEHFRPKGYVEGEPKGDPGYYWIGSDWDNLLLACQICNGQEFKGNHFPIKNQKNRVKDHNGNIEAEEPLLINPCTDESPDNHFKFTDKGEMIGIDDEGRHSVEYFGLAREKLRKARAKHLLNLNIHLINLGSNIESYNNSKNQTKEQAIRETIKHLKSLKADDAEFAALTRDFVNKKLYDWLPL